MRAELRGTLEGYVVHAEHFGTEEVFETALDEGLGLRDLGFLALRLQNLNPKWKLTLENQENFILALMDIGISSKDAARMVGTTVPTARLWHEATAPLEVDPFLALRLASNRRFEDLRGIVRGWHRTS